MVLAPIEPVAPSSVTVRSTKAGAGLSGFTRNVCDFIASPYQQTPPWRLESAAQQPDQGGEERSGDETVEAIHQAAVSRNELARILRPESALEGRLEQVAGLRDDREQDRKDGKRNETHKTGEPADGHRYQDGRNGTGKRARPGFLWADPRHELRAAER